MLLAADDTRSGKKFIDLMSKEITEQTNPQFDNMFIAKSIADTEYAMSNENVDALVILEVFSEIVPSGEKNVRKEIERVGRGTIQKWMGMYPDKKIILLLEDGKAGTKKTQALYDIGYYDALFYKDSKFSNILSLIAKGRTADEAREYYEVHRTEQTEIKQVEPVAEKVVQVPTEVKAVAEPVVTEQSLMVENAASEVAAEAEQESKMDVQFTIPLDNTHKPFDPTAIPAEVARVFKVVQVNSDGTALIYMQGGAMNPWDVGKRCVMVD